MKDLLSNALKATVAVCYIATPAHAESTGHFEDDADFTSAPQLVKSECFANQGGTTASDGQFGTQTFSEVESNSRVNIISRSELIKRVYQQWDECFNLNNFLSWFEANKTIYAWSVRARGPIAPGADAEWEYLFFANGRDATPFVAERTLWEE